MNLRRSFRTTVLAACTLLLLYGNATVAVAQNQSASPSKLHPGDLNTEFSRVYTFVDKTGLGHQHAIEGKLESGTLQLGAQTNAGELVFDMTSFDADTPRARKYIGLSGTTDSGTRRDVNANMKGTDILNVSRYPTATFAIKSALAAQETAGSSKAVYELVGEFTLHGRKRPLTVKAEVEQERGWLHVRGNFVIKQTDFGITPFSKAFGAIGVANALRIHGDLWVAPSIESTVPTSVDQ
ncbi:YceI family protein [Rhodopirellula sp. MGV]|uniref:YceI family protein n=1 Tax=Rhodopirellula sp. MGV TaxID=2023130 RepID=UPI000B962819|nr:YceI family protein [Rhodopirellula sp. MGV]OYP33937.1 hypothetical protein CGZ80_17310 [Rhodopirellula sp. MGV]PNY34082.1 YceI family protein [Rhodopirellula baltica]